MRLALPSTSTPRGRAAQVRPGGCDLPDRRPGDRQPRRRAVAELRSRGRRGRRGGRRSQHPPDLAVRADHSAEPRAGHRHDGHLLSVHGDHVVDPASGDWPPIRAAKHDDRQPGVVSDLFRHGAGVLRLLGGGHPTAARRDDRSGGRLSADHRTVPRVHGEPRRSKRAGGPHERRAGARGAGGRTHAAQRAWPRPSCCRRSSGRSRSAS